MKQTESEKLQVQIQAYLDNVLDVGALLEDAENRGGVLDHVDDLQHHNVQVGPGTQPTSPHSDFTAVIQCCLGCVAAERSSSGA